MGVGVHIDRSRVLAVALGLACVSVGVLVCAQPGSARVRASSGPASAGACVNDASVTTSPQCTLEGHRLPRRRPAFSLLAPGTVVSSSALLGDRAFLNSDEAVALTNGGNVQYPALSTNGGGVWRIDGPPLHVDAADGAEAVGSAGIAGPRTFFAYGSSVADVTTDRGRTWWETFLGENVLVVAPALRNELVAYVEQPVGNQQLNPAWQYVSRDGGRHWLYSTDFAGMPG